MMNPACPTGGSEPKEPPYMDGHRTKYRNANVTRSKMELRGPKNSMKRPSVSPDHSPGRPRSPTATLSQGSARHSVSYSRFSRSICTAVMGRNGRHRLAATIEQMFPKFEEAVILMYFDMLTNVLRPSRIPLSSTFRSFSSRIASELSRTVSTAVSTEMPTSATARTPSRPPSLISFLSPR